MVRVSSSTKIEEREKEICKIPTQNFFFGLFLALYCWSFSKKKKKCLSLSSAADNEELSNFFMSTTKQVKSRKAWLNGERERELDSAISALNATCKMAIVTDLCHQPFNKWFTRKSKN